MCTRRLVLSHARSVNRCSRPFQRNFGAPAVPVRERGALSTVRGTEAARVEPRSTAATAVGSTAAAIKNDVQSVGQRLARGSSDGVSYAADSPVLGKFFGPAPADAVPSPSRRCAPGVVDMPAAAAPATAPAEPRRSLAELRRLSAAELKQMLAVRGVGPGAATDKDALAEWTFQHQDLPVVQSASQAPGTSTSSGSAVQRRSLQELHNMPAAELRRMLAERGVSQGSATEKSELVQWVWQHIDLPVKYEGATGQRGGIGGHGWTRTHRSTRANSKDLVATEEDVDEIGDADERLQLTEGSDAEQKHDRESETARRWRLLWRVLGVSGAGLICLAGVLIANDAQQAAAATTEVSGEAPVQRTAG